MRLTWIVMLACGLPGCGTSFVAGDDAGAGGASATAPASSASSGAGGGSVVASSSTGAGAADGGGAAVGGGAPVAGPPAWANARGNAQHNALNTSTLPSFTGAPANYGMAQ